MRVRREIGVLFRQEVIQAQGAARILAGVPMLGSPGDAQRVGLIATGIAAALLALAHAPLPRTAVLQGHLEPDAPVLTLAAPTVGVLRTQQVVPGTMVDPDTVIAQLEPQGLGTGSAAQADRHRALDQQQAWLAQEVESRQRSLSFNVEAAQLAASQARHERTLFEEDAERQRQRVEVARGQWERLQALQAEGHTSAMQVDQARSQWMAEKQQLAAVEREQDARRHLEQRSRLEADRLAAEAEAVRMQFGRQMSETEHQKGALRHQHQALVHAPGVGRLLAWHVPVGTVVAAQDPLADFIAGTEPLQFVAVFWVGAATAAWLRAGQTAAVRLSAYPATHHGALAASVVQVDTSPAPVSAVRSALHWGVIGAGAWSRESEARIRVRVALPRTLTLRSGVVPHLSPGQRVQADVILEDRTVGQWAWSLLRGRPFERWSDGTVPART
jgi:biotin carboxyl carrier protein